MTGKYLELFNEFYANFWFGVTTLVVPTLIMAVLLALVFAGLAKLARARIGLLMSFNFILAFALVGSVSGVVAGWTLEAIVGAVLAAVMGLVSSMLAYLFSRDTLRAWRPVIPLAIGALLVSTLIGLVLGGSWRSQVLNMKEAAERAKIHFEKIYVPSELQRRSALIKRCIDESPTATEAADCG